MPHISGVICNIERIYMYGSLYQIASPRTPMHIKRNIRECTVIDKKICEEMGKERPRNNGPKQQLSSGIAFVRRCHPSRYWWHWFKLTSSSLLNLLKRMCFFLCVYWFGYVEPLAFRYHHSFLFTQSILLAHIRNEAENYMLITIVTSTINALRPFFCRNTVIYM